MNYMRYAGNRVFPKYNGKMLDLEIKGVQEFTGARLKKKFEIEAEYVKILTCEEAFSRDMYKLKIIKYSDNYYTYEIEKIYSGLKSIKSTDTN